MTDERFGEWLGEAGQHYNRPGQPPLDEMWSRIEARLELPAEKTIDLRPFLKASRPAWHQRPALRMAAMLVLGLAMGRVSASLGSGARPEVDPALSAAPLIETATRPYQSVTVDYLGETAALLVALPSELKAERTDANFVARADALLLQTRLLLDSPAATDPALRALFEDLEVVLAQILRLQADRDPVRVDLLQESLEMRDVMPRLRSAVVDHIAD